jgi:CRP-like cAMP-binding protein
LSIEAVKNNSKEFEISYDRQGLADYLGVERSAMSAELSKLRQEGILDSNKNKFKLLK